MMWKINIQNSLQPKELPAMFVGKGQVKGFSFKQIQCSNTAYIYEVSDNFDNLWYEVFLRRTDVRFGNISYPKANSFGITAWSAKTIGKAYSRFENLNKNSNF